VTVVMPAELVSSCLCKYMPVGLLSRDVVSLPSSSPEVKEAPSPAIVTTLRKGNEVTSRSASVQSKRVAALSFSYVNSPHLIGAKRVALDNVITTQCKDNVS